VVGPTPPGADSVFDGTAVDTRFGPVQVAVKIANGAVSDVEVLQSPDFDGRSRRINEQALPMLHDEALQAQSAAVDTIGGATYTSDAYAQSLQSAIDAARAAGVTRLL